MHKLMDVLWCSSAHTASCHTAEATDTGAGTLLFWPDSMAPNPYDFESKHQNLGGKTKKRYILSSLFRHSTDEARSLSESSSANQNITLSCNIETPPVMYYGPAEESSGALFGGQLCLDVLDDSVNVADLTAKLSIHVVYKRPYQGHCLGCREQDSEIESWAILSGSTGLCKGKHHFPFSTLLKGHLPASLDTPILCISYRFEVQAIARPPSSSSCYRVKLKRTIPVKRSLFEPLYPRHSLQVSPSNIRANVDYRKVVYPKAGNKLTLKLDGLMTHNHQMGIIELRKLTCVTWKLVETTKSIAPACKNHAAFAQSVATVDGQYIRGTLRTDTRVIGEKKIYGGWKSDYSANGTVDMEFDFYIGQHVGDNRTDNKTEQQYACSLRTTEGTEISHSLKVDIMMSNERAPEGSPQLAVHGGTCKMVKMSFAVVVAESPGPGASWDNEPLPAYTTLPPSPPKYTQLRAGSDARGAVMASAVYTSDERGDLLVGALHNTI